MTISTLASFLNVYSVAKGEEHTHTSMNGGLYNIPKFVMKSFWELYNRNVEDNVPMYLTECHEKLSPFIIDVDLRYPVITDVKKMYDHDFLKNILEKYVKYINMFLGIEKYNAYILERKSAYLYKNKVIKDGFHIVIPDVVTEPNLQYVIRDLVIKDCIKEYNNKPMTFTNDWKDIIDEDVIEKNNWTIYGSRKPGLDPYVVTHVYDNEMNPVNMENVDVKNLPEICSIQGKELHTPYNETMHQHMFNEYDKLDLAVKRRRKKKAEIMDYSLYNLERDSKPDDVEMAKKLVKLLSKERAESYTSWFEIGCCLYNISKSLFSSWDDFSKQSDKYEYNACIEKWNDMTYDPSGLTMGSLRYWAKKDSPEEYCQIDLDNKRNKITCLIQQTDDAYIAKALYLFYKDDFKCVESSGKNWYRYDNHRWIQDPKGLDLRKKISSEFFDEYYKIGSRYMTEISEETETTDREHKTDIGTRIMKTSKKLLQSTFKTTMMKESIENFYDDDFSTKLDDKPHLIGFENGVYDLQRMEFRDGRPDDYVSFSTGYDYEEIDLDDPDDKITQNLLLFLKQILPLPDIYKYILTFFASCLYGANLDELFHFLIGDSSNGKSKIVELFQETLGDYATSFNTTMLTAKRGASSGATADLSSLINKRVAVSSEPEEDSKLNKGFFKLLTGGDKLTGRDLYNPKEYHFRPKCGMIMHVNDYPDIGSSEPGTWRRIRAIKFPSKFVANPNPNKRFQYKRIDNIQEHFPLWRPRFMCLLLKYYQVYMTEDIIKNPPKCIQKTIEKYRRESDIYTCFFEERLDIAKEKIKKKDMITVKDVYMQFQEWFSVNHSNKKMPTKQVMQKGLDLILDRKSKDHSGRPVWPNIVWKPQILEDSSSEMDSEEESDDEY